MTATAQGVDRTGAPRPLRVIGLISGTSMDGIDVAVADLRRDGPVVTLAPIGGFTQSYDERLRADARAALRPEPIEVQQISTLDTQIGQAFARAAQHAVSRFGPADLICSHGQTIYHWVRDGRALGTLQVGQPAWIAEATGLPVVSDLRSRDIAAGGQGAPLVSILDAMLLGGHAGVSVALNLGGIANITVIGAGPAQAYDTGPANALLDAAVLDATGGALDHDRDGALAATGTVCADLLARLRADPYYARTPPKSTGKEHFNLSYLRQAQRGLPDIALPDLAATLVALTALTVAESVRSAGATRVLASGGGLRNPVLVALVRDALPGIGWQHTDDLGLPSDAKEAYAFALLGFLTWHCLGGTIASCTGASGPRVLGSITPGRAPLVLPGPAAEQPSRLVIDRAGG